MFKPSLCRYSTRSQMTLDMPEQKANTGPKKNTVKINPVIKIVKTSSFFMHSLKKSILLHLKT